CRRALSAARAICKLGKRILGTALQDHRTLAPGDVESGREGRPRLILVVAAERQQACAAQAIDFRQIEANAWLLDSGERTFEMREAVCGATGRQKDFSGQA